MGEMPALLDLGTGGPGPMAVLALSGLDPVSLPEPSLIEVIGQLDEQVAWLHSVRASHLAELARRHAADAVMPDLLPGEWREARAELPQWERETVGLRCAVTDYEARARIETAVALASRLPATAALLATGGVSWAHAVALAQETTPLDATSAGRLERLVHADSRAVTAGQVRRRARRLAVAMLPPADPAEQTERSLTAWSDQDSCTLQVRLDREGGEIVAACLDSLATRTDTDDHRTAATRRADALVEVCRDRLDTGDLPLTAAGTRPHLTLQMPLTALTSNAPAPVLAAGEASGAAGLAADLPAEALRRLSCDAGVTTMTHTAISHAAISHTATTDSAPVVDLGREHRYPTPALRRRLEARDGGCRFPTCDRPTRRCHAHHVTHWADGGPTDENNLILACARHHYLIHEGGWHLHFDGQTALWTDPNGRGYEARSPLVRPPEPDPDFYTWLSPASSPTARIPRCREPADPGPPPF